MAYNYVYVDLKSVCLFRFVGLLVLSLFLPEKNKE